MSGPEYFNQALNRGPVGPANRAATQATVNRTALAAWKFEYNRRKRIPAEQVATALGPMEAHEFRPHCLLFTFEGVDEVKSGAPAFRGPRVTQPNMASTRLFYALNGLRASDKWRFAGVAADRGQTAAQQELSQPVCSVRLSGLCTIPKYTHEGFMPGEYLYAVLPQEKLLADGSVGCNALDAGQHPQTMVPIYRSGSTGLMAALMGAAEDVALRSVAKVVSNPVQRDRASRGLQVNEEARQEVADSAAEVLNQLERGLSSMQNDHFVGTGGALSRYMHLTAALYGADNDEWMIDGMADVRYGRQQDMLAAVYANFEAAGLVGEYGGVGLRPGVDPAPYVRAAQGAAELYAGQLQDGAQRVQRRMVMEDLEDDDMELDGLLATRVALECRTQLNSEFRDRFIGRVVDEVGRDSTHVDVELRKE